MFVIVCPVAFACSLTRLDSPVIVVKLTLLAQYNILPTICRGLISLSSHLLPALCCQGLDPELLSLFLFD